VADVTLIVDEADNCTLVPLVTHVGDVSDGNTCPEIITRTYRITDDCGNFTNIVQTITVGDDTDPSGTAPVDITVQCSGDVPAADVTLIVDEADNCTALPTVTHVGDVSDGLTCPETITRTYNIADDCGNNIDVIQTITIDDDINPTGTAPADISVQCFADVPAADISLIVDEADNCTALPSVTHIGDVTDGGTCPEVITRTYRIEDDCGNFIDVVQNVTVSDDVNPTGTAPADITVQCVGDVPAADITLIVDEADNCTAAPIVTHVGDVSDGNTCQEIITRTYRIEDECGNYIDVIQTITVDDDINPTASDPVPVTVQCIGDVPVPDITVVTDEADNCTVAPVVAFVSDVSDGNTCPEIITRTYSVTDDCGNSITVVQTITVDDDINPTASDPAPVTVQCSGDAPAPDISVVTDEADNCTVTPVVAFVSDVSDGNTCPEIITRTYSVTDDCGNSINVIQTITIDDDINPTASNPAQIAVECSADVPAPDISVVTDEADNCTANPVVTFISDASDGNTCPETITRTYRVTDDCGNYTDLTQDIVILPTTAPNVPADGAATVVCAVDAVAPTTPIVTDVCGNNIVPTLVSTVPNPNPVSCEGTITYTYEYVDCAGLSTNWAFVYTVENTNVPIVPADESSTVECLVDAIAPTTPVVVDACGTNIPAFLESVVDTPDPLSCEGTRVYTYSYTDCASNISYWTYTYTIDISTAPIVPADGSATVECLADAIPPTTPVVTDVCGFNITPTLISTVDTPDPLSCEGTRTYTYEYSDCSGNTTNWSFVYTIDIITAPVLPADGSATVECLADAIEPTTPVVTDVCGNNITPSLVSTIDSPNPLTCEGTRTYTYEYSDCSGNTTNWLFVYTIDMSTIPVVPADGS